MMRQLWCKMWLLGLCCVSGLHAGEPFEWVSSPGELLLKQGSLPVIRCMTAFDTSTPERRDLTFKVFTHVYGPQSGELITKGPPGGLYPHHRGIYLGWNKTFVGDQSYDFWHGTKGAHQRLRQDPQFSVEQDRAECRLMINWNDAEGKPVVTELRQFTVSKPAAGITQVDVVSRLESQRGEIRLEGDRQHAGLQFRAPQSVADGKSARFLRPAGFPETPNAVEVDDSGNPPRHINLHWLAMTYPVGQQTYTVEYFEGPGLPTPSLFSERPYGRFGAYFKAKLNTDAPLTLRYRFRFSQGNPDSREAIQQRYDDFAKEVTSLKQK